MFLFFSLLNQQFVHIYTTYVIIHNTRTPFGILRSSLWPSFVAISSELLECISCCFLYWMDVHNLFNIFSFKVSVKKKENYEEAKWRVKINWQTNFMTHLPTHTNTHTHMQFRFWICNGIKWIKVENKVFCWLCCSCVN